MADAVLDIVAENPEVPHVPDQVQPAAMQEHRGHKGQSQRRERQLAGRP